MTQDDTTPARHRRPSRRARRNGRTLPPIEPTPSRRRLGLARFAIFVTAVGWVAYVVDQVSRAAAIGWSWRIGTELAVYLALVTSLVASAIAYLLTRLGHLYRVRDHRRVPRAHIDAAYEAFGDDVPSLGVLVPSYREEAGVIRQTVLSAALQEYPDITVTVLVDDPPNPTDEGHRAILQQAREVVAELDALLSEPAGWFRQAEHEYAERAAAGGAAAADELRTLAASYDEAVRWLDRTAIAVTTHPDADHTDEFLRRDVLGQLGDDLDLTARALREAADDPHSYVSRQRVAQLHRRLTWIFTARVTSFERKQFASLSHEANKAMNLNSYLGLMGGHYSIETSPAGQVLIATTPEHADLAVPTYDYVVTLDADSVLLPEYCLRLVHFMEQPEHASVGVVQTPYSAYRGDVTPVERIAGATTDIQHLVHQGLTHYGATFWVGANAVLRWSAIESLREDDVERGFPIVRYIADRTVIEDTESSIDLRAHGWQLANYPERLSYSATPPDYGSLVVQRKRWANGGLVILPKLVRLARDRKQLAPALRPTPTEVFLRANYLASITWSSLGLLVLLLYPFDQRMLSPFVVATALPYFVAMTSDLRRCGYFWRDIVLVYGFNLLLLPVNLAGSMSSVAQAIGGQKVDFARTPKIKGRTAAPLLFVVTPIVLLLWSAFSFARDVHHDDTVRAAFAVVNATTLLIAIVGFVGLRAVVVDLGVGVLRYAYVDRPTRSRTDEAPHWASVLYLGAALPDELDRSGPLAVALAASDQTLAFSPVPAPAMPDVAVAAAGERS